MKRSPAVCMSRCCVSIVKFVFCSSSWRRRPSVVSKLPAVETFKWNLVTYTPNGYVGTSAPRLLSKSSFPTRVRGIIVSYIHDFAHAQVSHVEGLGVNPSNAALLIGYMSIASTIGRLIFGKFSDHPMVNRLYLTQFAVLGFGVTTTLIPIATSYQSLAAMVVMLGLFDGLYVVLIAVVNTDIVGAHKLSHALGNLYGAISVTITVGPPLAGNVFQWGWGESSIW